MTAVFRKNEVSLFGSFYPVLGTIQNSLRQPFGTKQVFGDYTKDSEKDKSSITFRDNDGGIGIKDMVESKHGNRCFWSTCELGFPGHLIPGPLATDCGNPTTALTNPALMFEFNNKEYVCFGVDVRTWTEATSLFSASLRTLGAIPTDWVIHKSKLYLACGTDFERLTAPTTWTTGTTLTGGPKDTLFLLNWDEKLLRLDSTGLLSVSVDEGVTWTDNAQSNLAASSFTALILGRNSADYIVPYMGTTTGWYELDYDSSEWLDTGLQFPENANACKGAATWRDLSTYIPVGMGIYQFATAANPTQITSMGPDRDYGIPKEYRGSIVKILPELNGLYILASTSGSSVPQDVFASWNYWDTVIYDEEYYGILMKWSGKGWSVIKASANAVTDADVTGNIGTPDGNYRLWFAMEGKVWYIPLQSVLQNPLEIPEYQAQAIGEHIWGWFDADNSVVSKNGIDVSAYVERASGTEYVEIYYGTDYNDNSWTLLTNTTFTDGKIDADGETKFEFALGAGIEFKAIRFKALLKRSSTATAYPDLRWLRLEYLKIPDSSWIYNFVIDCAHDYRHKRASTLVGNLKTAAETKTLGDFVFRDFDGSSDTHKVKILSMVGPEVGGKLKEGQYKLQLLEI